MFTYSKLVEVDNSLCTLSSLIDEAIYKLSGNELDSIRFGVASKANYSLVELLEDYREIINRKVLGCNCINVSSNILGSRIRKITNISH